MSENNNGSLILLSKAEQALAEVKTLDEIVDLQIKVATIKTLADKQHWGRDDLNFLHEIELRSHYKGGKLWSELPRIPKNLLKKIDRNRDSGIPIPTRAELEKRGANVSAWRTIYSAPLTLMEEYIARTNSSENGLIFVRHYCEEARHWKLRQKAKARAGSASIIDSHITVGDFRIVGSKIADSTVDIIFTDPPYNRDALQLYSDLSAFAERVLRPGGICMAYSGGFFIPEVVARLGEHLKYVWEAGIRHMGGQERFQAYRIFNAWKPIWIYAKPPVEPWWDFFTDFQDGSGKEKDFHKWGQGVSEAKYYLSFLCPKGGVVLDPMCGGGTTLVAAKSLGMQYIGIELEEINAIKASSALAELE